MKQGSESKSGRKDVAPWMWWCLVILTVSSVIAVWRPFQSSPEEQFLDGVMAVERGEIAEAREIHRRLMQRGAIDEARVLQGGILTRLSEWQTALGFLDASMAQGHLRRPLLRWAGQCLMGIHELGRAEFVLRMLVTEFPDDPAAIRMLAVTYYDLGAMGPALSCLKQLQKLKLDDYRPHHLSGVIHLDFEQFSDAVSEFNEALSRRPPEAKRIEISENLAFAHIKLLQFAQALECLEGIPESSRSLAMQAMCYLAQDDVSKAEERIRVGRKLLTSSGEAETSLLKAEARLMSHLGDYESSLGILQRLAELEPHNVKTHHEISLVLGRLGRNAEQKAAIAKTEKLRELRNQLTELSNRANAAPYDFEVRIRLSAVCQELGLEELSRSWNQAAQAIQDSAEWRAKSLPADSGA
ncbi:MAG: hypothetical protein O2820_25765 [Planctomycetota bacterium]|nr:hypothetical protein [Planctomycetota bacterium]MDA1252620.1 hypothetical protein [Planctomycetota bacterium]